jgi:hypothetical protein
MALCTFYFCFPILTVLAKNFFTVTFNPHELLIGFVYFCGLSLLNAPWRTVPLLLPLFGSVPTDLA